MKALLKVEKILGIQPNHIVKLIKTFVMGIELNNLMQIEDEFCMKSDLYHQWWFITLTRRLSVLESWSLTAWLSRNRTLSITCQGKLFLQPSIIKTTWFMAGKTRRQTRWTRHSLCFSWFKRINPCFLLCKTKIEKHSKFSIWQSNVAWIHR